MRRPAGLSVLLLFVAAGAVQAQTASQAQLNAVNQKFGELGGNPDTRVNTVDTASGEARFRFTTKDKNLAIGAVTPEGVMQLAIIVPDSSIRVLSVARIELDANGKEKQNQVATQGQLRAISNGLNAADAKLDTLIVSMAADGSISYEVASAGGEKITADVPD